MIAYLKGLPWKDWSNALIGAGGVITVGLLTFYSKSRDAREARLKENMERDHAADVAQTQDLTVRLKVLMDGYEARIKELSAELISTKDELRQTRRDLDDLRRLINARA